MANWNGLLLTNKGIALQAKVQAGTQLHITKIKLGSGVVPSGTDIKTLTDLIAPNQNLGIGSKEAVDDYCKISSTISNTDLETGYYVRELGVFAQDPDDGEILYLYTTDSAPDYLPAGGGSTVISQEFSVMIAVDDTNDIKVDIDPAALATMGYVQVQVQEHNAAADAHTPAFEAHNKDLHAHPNRLRPGLKRSTVYAVGDIAFHDGLPSWAYLECTQAGTTASTEPILGGVLESYN